MERTIPASIVADALGCFWNAALSATHDYQDATANAVMSGMVQGVAAVAERLESWAKEAEAPTEITRKIYRDSPERSAYLAARFERGGRTSNSFEFEGHRWGYRFSSFDDQGDYDLIWRPVAKREAV